MATAFITYRIAFRAGFWEGIENEAQLNPYISLDEHWNTAITEKACNGCGDIFSGIGSQCPDCVCSDSCGCTLEERGLV